MDLDVEGVWAMLDPVRQVGARRTKAARLSKKLHKKDRDMASASSRVKTKMQQHNDTNIVRDTDRIEMDPADHQNARGWNRKWSPIGWLRSCWKAHKAQPSETLQGGPSRATPAAARPGRIMAWFFGGSASHIADVRAATASCFWELQRQKLESLPRTRLGVLEISFDETEHELQAETLDMGAVSGPLSLGMIHCNLSWYHDDTMERYPIILPPACLADQTAECLMALIKDRFPVNIGDLAEKAKIFIIAIDSDSAPSCLKVGKGIAHLPQLLGIQTSNTQLTLHPGCLMHQTAMVAASPLKYMKILNNMFAAATWLRRGKNRMLVKKEIKSAKVKPVFTEPRPSDIAYAESIMDLPNWSTDAELHDCVKTLLPEGLPAAVNPPAFLESIPGVEPKDNPRRQRRKRFRQMLTGNWRSQHPSSRTHSCPPGCCSNPEEVADKSFSALLEAWFDTNLQIPALNRWTKLFGPCWWLLVGLSCHNLLGQAMRKLLSQVRGNSHDDGASLPAAGEPMSMEEHRRLEEKRLNRTGRWLAQQHCRPNLATAAVTLRPLHAVLSKLFEGIREMPETMANTVVPFCSAVSNPARKLILYYMARLDDPHHPYWLPISNGQWQQYDLRTAATCTLIVVAELFMRLVKPFETYPWCLITQTELARLLRAKPCCVESFADGIKTMLQAAGRDARMIDWIHEIIKEALLACPSVNIPNEDRFARTAFHCRSNNGGVVTMEAVATRHVLCELGAQHGTAYRIWQGTQPKLERTSSGEVTFCNVWSAFVHCKTGQDWAALSSEWAQLSVEQKMVYNYIWHEAAVMRGASGSKTPKERSRLLHHECLKRRHRGQWGAMIGHSGQNFWKVDKLELRTMHGQAKFHLKYSRCQPLQSARSRYVGTCCSTDNASWTCLL